MRHALLIAALLALAGCANTAPPAADAVVAAAPAAGASAPQQVCHKEAKVGSQIPTTVCEAAMTESERAAQMRQIQDQIRTQNTASHQGIGS